MSSCKLNVDVFLVIMSFADTTTVSNLMRTSSTLHREGTRFLLRDVVDLKSGPQVTAFRSFMKNSLTHRRRVSLLHSLQLSMATISSTAAISLEHLFGCLNTCGKLERLLLSHTELILSANVGMVAAVSRLTTLKEVVLLKSGYCCVALLRCLCSSLTAACIEFDGDDQERILDPNDPYPSNTRDPIQLLSHSRDTLTTLYVGSPGHSSPDGPVYPFLRELNIEHGPPPVLSHLIRAFPNLTSINFPDATPERLELEAVELPRHREMNIAHQVSHGSWSSLDEIEAEEILLLYLLALQCPVRVLRTDIHYTDDVDLLAEVLTDLTPGVLELRIDEAYMINTDTGIVDALCETRDPQITELRLFVEFQCRDVALDVDAFLVRTANVLCAETQR